MWWRLTLLCLGQSLSAFAGTKCDGEAPSRIDVQPRILKESGQQVVASWSRISGLPGDWLGIFDGATGEHLFTKHDVSVLMTPLHSYTLYNLRRGGYIFRYFRSNGNLAGCSDAVTFDMGDGEPTQLHTALTGLATSVRIMWITARPDRPVVEVGSQSGSYSARHWGNSTTYAASDMCEKTRIWQEPGYTHDVLLENLHPGRAYFFRYGNAAVLGSDITWAPREASVTLPPLAGSPNPFDVLFANDMGNSRAYCSNCTADLLDDLEYQQEAGDFGRGAAAVVASMQKKLGSTHRPAFIAHVGDLSYACGVEMKWDYWMQTISPLSSQVPYMIGIGNHEYSYILGAGRDPSGASEPYRPPSGLGVYGDDSLGECGVPTARRFHMPDNGNSVFWYSFEVGLAHFIMISLEHNVSAGSPQRAWLESDLNAVNRTLTPWVIVSSHRPLYCSEVSSKGDYDNGLVHASILDNLLQEHMVNLFIGGHYHAYERTCPVHQGTCAGDALKPQAPVHITVGTGGIAVDLGKWDAPWSILHVDPAYGYGRLSIVNDTSLNWQYANVSDDGTETVLDDVWIHQYSQTSAAERHLRNRSAAPTSTPSYRIIYSLKS